jgi:hypothetical protein
MTTNNKQRTMNSLKQSQTKPNLPAYMAGKFALSAVEGPVYSVPSEVEGSIKTIIRLRRVQKAGMG